MTQYQNWNWEPISKHIKSFQSGIASGNKSRDTGYPHLRMNNISVRFTLNQDELWYIPASNEDTIRYSINKGDLLFNNTNSAELVGKSCVFDIDTDKVFLFSNHLTRIRTKDSLDSLYLLYWIQSLWAKGYFKDNCTKWVNQAAVRPEAVLFTKEVFLPPTIDEQRAFANKIRTAITHVEEMRKTVLKQKDAIEALPAAILRNIFNFEDIAR